MSSATHNGRVTIAGRGFRLVDLSVTISNETSAFEPLPHEIVYSDHRAGAETMGRLLGEGAAWPGELAAADEVVTLPSHCGTHVDAPYHYGPESGGAPARTVDEVPLDWWFGDAFVIDMAHKGPGEGIDEADVRGALERIGHTVRRNEIALVRTDASDRFDEPGYHQTHPGLHRSATEWLVRQGVRLIGIDAWGLDRPFNVMAADLRAGDPDQLWESHLFGRELEYCQIEKLTNLRALPPSGFSLAAFPVKLHRASGAWARVVAFLPEDA